MAEENKRGFHTIDAGKSELKLYHRYKKNAEGLQEQYPKTAEIYFELSNIYKQEADFVEPLPILLFVGNRRHPVFISDKGNSIRISYCKLWF